VHSDFFPFISSNSFFVDPLSSNKQKDDLVTLSGALGLKTVAIIHKLITQIKSHLNAHPEVQQNATLFWVVSSNSVALGGQWPH
jgi:hypothetical protein